MPAIEQRRWRHRRSASAPARPAARTWPARITLQPSKASSSEYRRHRPPELHWQGRWPRQSRPEQSLPQCPSLRRPPRRPYSPAQRSSSSRVPNTPPKPLACTSKVSYPSDPRLSHRRRPGHRCHQRPWPRPRRICRPCRPGHPFSTSHRRHRPPTDWDGVVNVAFQLAG